MGFPCMIYSTDILITLHPFAKATAPFIIQQRHTNTALCFITSQLLNQVQHFWNIFKILWWLEKQQPGCHCSNLDCYLENILINSFELHFCFVRPNLSEAQNSVSGQAKARILFKIGQNRLSKEFSPLHRRFYFTQLPAHSSLSLLFVLKQHIKLAVIFLHLIILVFYSVATISFVMCMLVCNSTMQNAVSCCLVV